MPSPSPNDPTNSQPDNSEGTESHSQSSSQEPSTDGDPDTEQSQTPSELTLPEQDSIIDTTTDVSTPKESPPETPSRSTPLSQPHSPTEADLRSDTDTDTDTGNDTHTDTGPENPDHGDHLQTPSGSADSSPSDISSSEQPPQGDSPPDPEDAPFSTLNQQDALTPPTHEADQPDTPVSPPRPPEELPQRPPPPPDSLESPSDKEKTDPHTTIPGVQTPLDDPDTDPPANAITDGKSEPDLQRTKPFFEDAPTVDEVAESFQNSSRPSPDNNGWNQSSPDPETTATPQSRSSPPPNSSGTPITRETSGQPTPSDTGTQGHLLTALVVKLLVLPAQLIAYLWVPWMLLGCFALVEILAGDTAAVATAIPDALPTQTTPQLFLSTVCLGFGIPIAAILIDLHYVHNTRWGAQSSQ